MPCVAHNQITELGWQLPFDAMLQECGFITQCALQLSVSLLLVLDLGGNLLAAKEVGSQMLKFWVFNSPNTFEFLV